MQNIKESITRPREVALYSVTEGGSLLVLEVSYKKYDENFQPLPEDDRRECGISGFIRVSEPVKVTFTAIDNDMMVRNAVQSLNEEERKLIDELNTKLAQIRERKSQLLALTHQVDA